jgi:uncharacterized protein YcfJ
MKYFEKVFHLVVLSCTLGMFSGLAFSGESNVMGQTRDVYKTVIQQKPYTVEVCRQVNVPGDRTADTIAGAIIGGVIGHQIDHKDGAKIGGVLGGMLGNKNSDARGSTQTQCQTETRYEEETVEIYSHSIITFWNNGKEYRVRYQR